MELDSRVFVDVLGPLAAFSEWRGSGDPGSDSDPKPKPEPDLDSHPRGDVIPDRHRDGVVTTDWAFSPLNPQSRIDSLDPSSTHSLWRVDGADVDGRRFFAVPGFAVGSIPLRIDVYLPAIEEYPRGLREVLRPETLLYVDSKRIRSLPITVHITRALDYWAASRHDFEEEYRSMPFGSQILVTDVAASIHETASAICLCPNYDVEQAMLSVDALQGMWQFSGDALWPPSISLSDLKLIKQLHEAITLVTMPDSDQEMVFKSLLRDQRYLYNELRMLLSLPPHENIIPRPEYVVTHRSRFGGKVGVVGFILRYYPRGSLKGFLLDCHSHPSQPECQAEASSTPNKAHLARLSLQIASALQHINTALPSAGFYPDLKPDNIVLSASGSPILLDLEQRGGWYAWSAPEVSAVEYLEVISRAIASGDLIVSDGEAEEITELLRGHLPNFHPRPSTCREERRYEPVKGGFSPIWVDLLRRRTEGQSLELEKAQVFMLGKLLWCIWEGQAMVRCGIDYELLQDRNPFGKKFPEFVNCPGQIRELIKRCTLGAREWDFPREKTLAVREGRLVVLDGKGDIARQNPGELARAWWVGEITRAKEFLRKKRPGNSGSGSGDKMKAEMEEWEWRPGLDEVIEELKRVEVSGL